MRRKGSKERERERERERGERERVGNFQFHDKSPIIENQKAIIKERRRKYYCVVFFSFSPFLYSDTIQKSQITSSKHHYHIHNNGSLKAIKEKVSTCTPRKTFDPPSCESTLG